MVSTHIPITVLESSMVNSAGKIAMRQISQRLLAFEDCAKKISELFDCVLIVHLAAGDADVLFYILPGRMLCDSSCC